MQTQVGKEPTHLRIEHKYPSSTSTFTRRRKLKMTYGCISSGRRVNHLIRRSDHFRRMKSTTVRRQVSLLIREWRKNMRRCCCDIFMEHSRHSLEELHRMLKINRNRKNQQTSRKKREWLSKIIKNPKKPCKVKKMGIKEMANQRMNKTKIFRSTVNLQKFNHQLHLEKPQRLHNNSSSNPLRFPFLSSSINTSSAILI